MKPRDLRPNEVVEAAMKNLENALAHQAGMKCVGSISFFMLQGEKGGIPGFCSNVQPGVLLDPENVARIIRDFSNYLNDIVINEKARVRKCPPPPPKGGA